MRTTLTVDDDVLAAARARAAREGRSVGAVLSDLARAGLQAGRHANVADGDGPSATFGFRPISSRGGVVTNEIIDALLADADGSAAHPSTMGQPRRGPNKRIGIRPAFRRVADESELVTNVGADEAKAQLSKLLDEVEAGRTVTITPARAGRRPAGPRGADDVQVRGDRSDARIPRRSRCQPRGDPGDDRRRPPLMAVVIDASVALAWCFDDETGDVADMAFDRLEREPGHVPTVWPLEIANTLVVAERRQHIELPDRDRYLALLTGLALAVDPNPPGIADLVALPAEHGLSAYDASYLELAERLGATLATLDAGLAKAARAAGVAVLDTPGSRPR